MLQIWVIVMLGLVLAADSMTGMTFSSAAAEWTTTSAFSGWKFAGALLMPVSIAGLTHIVCVLCGAAMDRRGSGAAIVAADRMVFWARPLVVVSLAGAVFTLDWLGQVRTVIGDLPAIDEAVATLPFIAVFVAGWWSIYPIERRIRGATLIRTLDDGGTIHPLPTRGQFVWSRVRHDLLLVLVPVSLIACWSEIVRVLMAWLGERAPGSGGMVQELLLPMQSEAGRALVQAGFQLIGVALVFTVAPLILRWIWDTVRIERGPLRSDLEALCTAAGVRVRDLLIWRTHGTMINGAAVGMVPGLRYILLTDALLENLPSGQVRAVMAHEVGHVRHKHIPWLVLSVLGTAGVLSLALELSLLASARLAGVSIGPGSEPLWLQLAGVATGVLSIAGTFAVFGCVSRRFEWQADAFAARVLSATGPQDAAGRITDEGAAAMIEALGSVARLNHIPRGRRSFRHGSILTRQRRLGTIVGRAADDLPQDRHVRWIKRGILVALAITLGAIGWEVAVSVPDDRAAPASHDAIAGGLHP